MTRQYLMDQSKMYRITVRGRLDDSWGAYFEDLELCHTLTENAGWITTLTGKLVDQAALQGTLQKLYALGMPLISVESIEAGEYHPP